MKRLFVLLVLLGFAFGIALPSTTTSNFEFWRKLKPLAKQRQGDVIVSIVAIYRDGYLRALPGFALQEEKGASIYVFAEREGKPFPVSTSFPNGTMSWEDDKGHKAPIQAAAMFIETENPRYFYARNTWKNLTIPTSSQRLNITFNLSLPERKYTFIFKDVRLPQEKANVSGKPLSNPLPVGSKVNIEGREYAVIASQVQKDIRVSLIYISRKSVFLELPGEKGIEIGFLVEGFGEPLPKEMFPLFPISNITWRDDKGRTPSKGKTPSNFNVICYTGRKLLDSQNEVPKGVAVPWKYRESGFWPGSDFSQSAKYLTVEYRLFIYPDRRYSFVFQNIPIPK